MKKLFACLAVVTTPLAMSLLTVGLVKIAFVVATLIPVAPTTAVLVGLVFLLIGLFLGIDATTSVLIGV